MQQGSWLQTLLPFVIIAIVMLRRWRSIDTPVPVRPGRLWIMPAVLLGVITAMLYALPPSPVGWLVFGASLLVGGAVGFQRARLMRLHLDEGSGAVMMRQSPAALLFIIALFLFRRLIMPQGGAEPVGAAAHPALPLATDAALGFALGMVIGMRIELWRRAKALQAAA